MGSSMPNGRDGAQGRGLLGRLRRDTRGMTLAMMAAFLVPISALAGSAVDLARMYVVKSRLQQACDAGVLAGRKFMNDSNTSTTLDTTATQRATDFFNNNFKAGWLGTTNVSFTPTKTTDNQVSGSATADVPMTVMKMFGFGDNTIPVTCKARFDVADTDIMFVLDTTGSMSCLPGDSDTVCDSYAVSAGRTTYTRPSGLPDAVAGYAGSTGYGTTEKAGSRIAAIRTAVLNFYDTFAANADPSTHVRYGFVTYSSMVNGGGAIMGVAPQMIIGSSASETAPYQTRYIDTTNNTSGQYTLTTAGSTTYPNPNPSSAKTQANCTASVRSPLAENTFSTSTGTATRTLDEWVPASGRVAAYCRQRVDTLGPKWTYKQWNLNVQAFVSSATTDVAATDPTKVRGETTKWAGCLEEPASTTTVRASSYTTTSLPTDLNPDSTRSLSGSTDTRWFPYWPDVEYMRNANVGTPYAVSFSSRNSVTTNGDDNATSPSFGNPTYLQYFQSVCAKPVQRWATLTRSQVNDYVTAVDFVPLGYTYHDIGMIWGLRLISLRGLFAADTAAWPNRNAPNRVIVFMTDGDMKPNANVYSAHGVEYFDGRVSGTDTGNLVTYHNRRFQAECAAAKARNIDIWVVQIDSASSTEMQSCATTTSQALHSNSGTGLSDAFASIAEHLAMLRITQ